MCATPRLDDSGDMTSSNFICFRIFLISLIIHAVCLVCDTVSNCCVHLSSKREIGSSKQEIIACRTWSLSTMTILPHMFSVFSGTDLDVTKILWHVSFKLKRYNKLNKAGFEIHFRIKFSNHTLILILAYYIFGIWYIFCFLVRNNHLMLINYAREMEYSLFECFFFHKTISYITLIFGCILRIFFSRENIDFLGIWKTFILICTSNE